MLLKQIKDAAPKVGSLIYISYEGKRKTKDGQRDYNMYQIRAEDTDWDMWIELDREFTFKDKGGDDYGQSGGETKPAVTKTNLGPDDAPF